MNSSDLKFNLAGNLPITLLLAVGRQNELKYFYLTAAALADKIVALIFLYTQKPKVGFPVLACDEDCRRVVTSWHGPQVLADLTRWFLKSLSVQSCWEQGRKLGLNPSLAESCGTVISPLQLFFFCLAILCPITRKPWPFPKWASQYYHSSVSRPLQGW